MTETPPEDPRDALTREQAAQIAALTALVAELREQLDAAPRAASRNPGNSSVPPGSDDLPGRKPPGRSAGRWSGRGRSGTGGSSPAHREPRCAGARRTRSPITSRRARAHAARDLPGAADPGVARSHRQEDIPEPRPALRYRHDLRRARCAHGREHPAERPAGDEKYVHGAFTELYSAFHPGTRSVETMKEVGILSSFAGIAVTGRCQGCFSGTWAGPAGHQARTAQLIRDFADCAEACPGVGRPGQARRALRGLVRARRAAREQGLPAVPGEVREPLEPGFRRAVTFGLARVPRVPGPGTP